VQVRAVTVRVKVDVRRSRREVLDDIRVLGRGLPRQLAILLLDGKLTELELASNPS